MCGRRRSGSPTQMSVYVYCLSLILMRRTSVASHTKHSYQREGTGESGREGVGICENI